MVARISLVCPSFIEMAVVSQDIIAPFVPKWVRSARKKDIPNIY